MNNRSPIKVAIADDHEMFRLGIIRVISSNSALKVIIEAHNGDDLIQKIEQSAEVPDICLLDINMPNMNGYDTLNYLRRNWSKIRVLAFSMHDNEYAILKMLKNGARGYLAKVLKPEELVEAIFAVHNIGYYNNELTTSQKVQDLLDRDINLSTNEMMFLKYCGKDMTYQSIANDLNISRRTVEGYRDALFKKLNVSSRAALATLALQIGLVKN